MPRKAEALPRPTAGQEVDAMPEPEVQSGNPFIKATDIGKGCTLRLVGNLRASSSEFSDFIVDVKKGNKDYALGLKVSSGNYARLFDRFGRNPKKWRGVIKVQPATHMGKKYVQIV